MGFLSNLFKSDLAKMALPMALGWAMPAMGISSLFGGISNPMLRSAIEQSLIGYGTAHLTGSKHPEKAAMYAGLGSLPFSFLKANAAADAFNKQYAGKDPSIYKTFREQLTPEIKAQASQPIYGGEYGKIMGRTPAIAAAEATYGPWKLPEGATIPEPIDAWDVLGGKKYNIPKTRSTDKLLEQLTGDFTTIDGKTVPKTQFMTPWEISQEKIPGVEGYMPAEEFDFYSKVGTGGKNLLGQELVEGKTYTDWLPTIASQTAGWYGGRPTQEELWEDAKSKRRKELAFMYGIDEDLMGGELQNPYYGGGGFWKDGGIAALEMDAGGAVNGPGGPKDDVIDAKLSDGEFVMTAKAVENFGGGNRLAGAKRMYNMMNQLDPQSETVQESVIGVA
jgi:hypothetical protein